MDYWLFDLLAVALPAALLLRGRRLPSGRAALLAGVALLWTAPWDEHLVRSGVWSYGPDRVLATAGSVPVEEYAFVVLLVVLTAAWGGRTGLLDGPVLPPTGGRGGALAWGAAGLLGLCLAAAGGQVRYLGLLLVWAAPPLALQAGLAGDLLRPQRLRRLLLAGPVALWLCAADRLALADGVWAISPTSSTGVLVLGLPLEEALFFMLTCTLVADGLLLAGDPRALARARRLLPAARTRSLPGSRSVVTAPRPTV